MVFENVTNANFSNMCNLDLNPIDFSNEATTFCTILSINTYSSCFQKKR